MAQLENEVLADLELQLTLNIDRGHWERRGRIADEDIVMTRDIIMDTFTSWLDRYHGTYVEPLIATLEYATFVAARTVLLSGMYHGLYAVERMIEDVIRAVRRVMADFHDELIEKTHRLHVSARRIQRIWKEAVSNPSFQVCKNRLLREFCANRVLIPG